MLGFGLNRLPVLALSSCKRMPCRPDDPGVGVAPFEDGRGADLDRSVPPGAVACLD